MSRNKKNSPSFVVLAAATTLSVSLLGCSIFADVERQELAAEQRNKDEQRMALNCQNSAQQLYDTYCDGAMKTVPVGMTDQIARQRNGLAMNCKDPGSEAKLAEIDTCLEELAQNE